METTTCKWCGKQITSIIEDAYVWMDEGDLPPYDHHVICRDCWIEIVKKESKHPYDNA